MTKEDILHYFQDINFRYNDCMMYDNLSHMLDELISECQQADNADNKERLKDIRGWLIENIFREGYVMYSDAREVNGIDLIERDPVMDSASEMIGVIPSFVNSSLLQAIRYSSSSCKGSTASICSFLQISRITCR